MARSLENSVVVPEESPRRHRGSSKTMQLTLCRSMMITITMRLNRDEEDKEL